MRYGLSHGFATAIIGTHSLEELEENICIACGFQPLGEQQCRQTEKRVTGKGGRLWALRA